MNARNAMSDEIPQVQEFVVLYRRAFELYGIRALWNVRQYEEPEPGDALAVARALRIEGDMQARFLAEEIERACLAAV
jgi:hypothetical protein